MRTYYYQEGDKQVGPLTLDQLKEKNITSRTPVWYDPLPKWTTAGEVPELKELYDKQPVAQPTVREYYYKTGDKQYGPLTLENLQGKNIVASTPVWHHPLAEWTTAGKVAELKSIIQQTPVAAAQPAVKEYYYKEGESQYGPLKFDEIKTKTITPDTPVWYHPMPKWVKAEEVAELRPFLIIPAPKSLIKEVKAETPVIETPKPSSVINEIKEQTKSATQIAEPEVMTVAPVKEEVKPKVEKPVTAAATATASIATAPVTIPAATPAPVTKTAPQLASVPPKKGAAWITWALSSLVIAGAAFFVYQDMNKNKKTSDNLEVISTTTSADNTSTTTDQPDPNKVTSQVPTSDVTAAPVNDPVTTPPATAPITTQKTNTSATTAKEKKPATATTQTATATRSNAEEDKAKSAATTLAAREADIRNHWQNYITFGRYDYKARALSGIDAFFIPVINNSDYMLDEVTIWVDYIKKGGGVHKSETIVINNIPPHSTLLGKANGNSRGTSVKTTITAISCKKLHFCYPMNNGTADPFYCK